MGHPRHVLEEMSSPGSETVAVQPRTPAKILNTHPPPPPSMRTPPPWSGQTATIDSAFSLDDRSVGNDDTNEYTFSTPTQIWEHHGPGSWLSLCSEPGVSWAAEKIGGENFAKSAQKLTAAWNRRWQFDTKTPTNSNRVDGSEPEPATAWKYCTAYFDHCFESVFGVVYRPDFEARLHAHFRQGGAPSSSSLPGGRGGSGEDVAWYALRNTVYAAGCRQLLLKDGSTPYADAQAEGFRYFQNALAVHTDLIYRPSGIEAIRAVTAMAFYVEAAANECFEYMMCANAVRLAQAKGLHRQPSKSLNLSENEAMHRSWLFWAIFSLEKLISFRSGRPSAIDDDNISCEIPRQAPPGSTIDVKFFTDAVKAARLASDMGSRLCSVQALRQNPAEIIEAANDIRRKAEEWREGVGADFQTPGKPIQLALLRPNMRPLHIIYLQVMYYLGIQSNYAIFAFPWVGSILGLDKHPHFQEQAAIRATQVAEAARMLILIAKSMHIDATIPQWASFYFPLAGLTNLFVYILNGPDQPSALADVALLDVAAGHYSHMEYLTASQRGSLFAREVACLARATVERAANRKQPIDTHIVPLPPLTAAELRDDGSAQSLFQPPESFDADQFDMEGWNIYSMVLNDGMLAGNNVLGFAPDE
ncbi:Fungal specific transcription factor domain-containing protein [Cladophialophora immunda]|nr:Fungal specific transcription factor domain-containing protein [Cladophialophora immunda]